ncbi:uncharacterized protein BDW43DRAFT_306312 [Aspergillus alliaceus]|uniref:uncharacterized protein n=1 Tax=Petromyces alliaceus TaxID=209559 RepID=UPI0012A54B47|nr:uncharacterized protein BDW43DRAFT_306312 [Aspergillus alliaceus]KAB8238452.1 hypothetical protein BDW43DRAFT_306312 [Aspergillus alliaceus]
MSPNLRRVLVGNKSGTSKGLLPNIALLYRILNGRVVQALKLVAPDSWVDSESAKIGDPLSGDVDVAEINIDLHSKILAQVLAQGFMDAQINGAFGFSSSNFNCLTNPKKFQNGSHHFNRVILSQIKSSTLPREDPDLVVLEDDHGYIARLGDSPAVESEPCEIRVTHTATESINADEDKMITVPKSNREGKAPAGPIAHVPTNTKVDTRGYYIAPIPFSWLRLQFRSTTAKGGGCKEKSTEQYFTVHIRIFSLFPPLSEALLPEKLSAPIVVHEKSPTSFSKTKASLINLERSPDDIGPRK